MLNRYLSQMILGAAMVGVCLPYPAFAAVPVIAAIEPTVTSVVDDADGVVLEHDAPLVKHKVTDNGAITKGAVLEHVQLVLKRPAARQAALDRLVAEQLDPASANFHKWVLPEEFGPAFGPAMSDVEKVVTWLQSRHLTVGKISPDRMSLEFGGTAEQINAAFQTELHDVIKTTGAHHTANVTAPVIPAALSGVVHGVTLSNFFPRPALRPVGSAHRDAHGQWSVTKPAPGFNVPYKNRTIFAVTPPDLAAIYDINPARQGSPNIIDPNTGNPMPITGKGVTLIVAEQTNIKPGDWDNFRRMFGLTGTAGRLSMVHPGGCTDPGFTPDEGEAALDAEWSSAVASDALIIEASCAATPTTFGVMTTLQNLVNHGPMGSVISISYGGCEVGNGLSFQAMWTHLVEQAAAEGISVFVSTGDSASAGCDNPNTASEAIGGLAVNGLASNIYDTAVGGTDFSDTVDHTSGDYWATTNSRIGGSALSYIPEIPWDDSCASSVIWKSKGAKSALAYCNDPANTLLNIVGGSGGKSAYYAKPSWQSPSILGVPNDGARGLPDVSLFASNGIWNHFYIYCMSDPNNFGVPCDYTNINDVFGSAAGGTSFSAPIFAGIQALVVQLKGGKVGNAAPRLYQLAQLQFADSFLLSTCNSNLGVNISPACVFNEVVRGDIAVPCKAGTRNCFTDATATAGIGVLSTSRTKDAAAYPAHLGWNFATGLGSVDVTNLLINY